MKITRKKLWIAAGAVFGLALVTFVAVFWLRFEPLLNECYCYESSDGGWADREILFKGRYLPDVEYSFADYKKRKDDPDLQMYRTTRRHWEYSNTWWGNLTHRRWKIPFRESEIMKKAPDKENVVEDR